MQAVTPFQQPLEAVGHLTAAAATQLLTAAADVAVIVDGEGVVQDVAFGSQDLAAEGFARWIGQRWSDTVTIESRPKIEALLRDGGADGGGRRRQVNHPSSKGDVPVLYGTVRVGPSGRVIALGRDLRNVAALQQRLVRAQQSLEVDYARLRQAELRYRLLFQITADAILIVDATTLDIVEANPAAARILERNAPELAGCPLKQVLPATGLESVRTMLTRLAGAPTADPVQITLPGQPLPFTLSASLVRQDESLHALLRLVPESGLAGTSSQQTEPSSLLLDVVARLPDGFVVTDLAGQIIAANPAFSDMVHLTSANQVRGRPLQQWLGRGAVDRSVLLANLREHGSIRLYATTLRDAHGGSVDVEISAVSVPGGEQPCLGFAIRHIGRRMATAIGGDRQLPQSVQQLTELVGRVPMKDLVRDTTDLIERMCIEAALYLTGDNRASAAEILGLSRQSLYVKLRRHGIGNIGQDVENSSGKDGA